MNISDVKEFFDSFKCESLTSNEQNRDDIKFFSSNIQNSTSLEEYLKTDAWAEDKDGKTRTYIVRDPENNKIVLYFSIKCGLVFSTDEIDDKYQQLKEHEKMIVNQLVEMLSHNQKIDDAYESFKSIYPNLSYLKSLAQERKRRKIGFSDMGDYSNIYKVDKCYSAIELQYLCKCDDFTVPQKFLAVPQKSGGYLGFGLFWQVIVPQIVDISKKVGCEYLYLFAADHSENKEDKKLIKHYKEALMFGELSDYDIILLKPNDNKNCLGLAQPINSLLACRDSAWEKYSDHFIKADEISVCPEQVFDGNDLDSYKI